MIVNLQEDGEEGKFGAREDIKQIVKLVVA
jgi:hypothetical protein